MKKPVKKTKKAPIKKVLTVKKAPKKKLTTKKAVISKNKPILRKKLVFKKKKSLKPLGIFVAIGGALSMVAITSVVFANLNQVATTDSSVLGSNSTGLLAPTDLKYTIKNYNVSLNWGNVEEGEYQYVLWAYDSATGKYVHKRIISGTAKLGEKITADFDQTPGSTGLYKVSGCSGCTISNTNTLEGTVGSLSSGVVVNVPKIATPSGLEASSSDAGVTLLWKEVKGVDNYDIWRSTAIFGLNGYIKVASVGTAGTYSTWHTYNADGTLDIPINITAPYYYTDVTAIPGRTYYYKVSARKMIAPLTYSKGWQNVGSGRSATAKVVVRKLTTPSGFKINAEKKDRASMVVRISDSVLAVNNYYLYCDNCSTKKMKLNSLDSPMIEFGGVTADGKTISYVINGLTANTTYRFYLTRYRVISGRTYESAKSITRTIITPNIDAPAAATGFEFDGPVVHGGLAFKWDIPEKSVDGYKMGIQCTNGDVATKTWTGDPVPSVRSGGSSLGNFYGIDIEDFGTGMGNCYAWLRAYDISNNVKVLSNYANVTFKN